MDRLTGFLTDWTTRGEKGYRVVGEQPETGRYQNSMPSKKVGRIAIFTLVALVLGFTLYSFSPVAFTSLDALHDEVHGEVEPAKQPSPVESDDWVPTGPPDIDWGFLKEQSQPHRVPSTTALGTSASDAPDAAVDEAPPTETTPVPPSEEDFYGVPPSETPHVPGPDTDVDHSSEEAASAPSSAGPVPEADLKPQSEQDFSGGLPKEAPQDTEADSERPEAEEHEEWGEPMPEEWEEPTPPEWDEPQGSSEGKDKGESTAEEENQEPEAKDEETEFEDKDAPLDWEDVPYMVEEMDQLKPEDEEARSILR